MRCDSDPRILTSIPQSYPFLRATWLEYAVPSYQGRVLISGDVAYIYGKAPSVKTNGRLMPGKMHKDFCPKAQPTKDTGHPCPRNLAHVEWLIEKFTAPSDVILDPFMGSGTTAVAAVNRGRKFIGIEIEKRHWETSIERIKKCAD